MSEPVPGSFSEGGCAWKHAQRDFQERQKKVKSAQGRRMKEHDRGN